MRPIYRYSLGVLCLLGALVFLLTPLTPGSWIFLLVGLDLLGLGYLIPKLWREAANRHKKTLKEKIGRWWRKLTRRK